MEITVRRHVLTGASALGLVALLVVALLFGVAGQASASTSTSQATLAPVSSAFLDYLQAKARGDVSMRTSEGRWLGFVPAPLDLSYTRGMRVVLPDVVGVVPSTYDLRDYGRVTAVKNQGSFGTCWTFATYGSLESSLLTGETQDFSEDNLALQSGFWASGASASTRYNNGGNFNMSTAYLTRWGGPVTESDDGYGDSLTPSGLTARKHVQEVNWLPARDSAIDNDNIKNAVMQEGGVYVAMYWPSSTAPYYKSTNASFYYNGTASTNHAVVIVGWDDGYSASNFVSSPAGNGAFLVKNSWGTSWGNAGYFWVSYYDTRFGRTNEMAVFNDAQSNTNYTGIYQYDPLGSTTSMYYGSATSGVGWFGNVFTASSTDTVTAVGFYTMYPNTSYEIYTGSSLAGKTLNTSGTIAYMGYHTVTLSTPLNVTNGQAFALAVKVTTPGSGSETMWPVAIEYPISGYSDQAAASPGQSWVSSNGSTWVDTTGVFSDTTEVNACLKAYTGSGGSSTSYTLATSVSGSGTVSRNPDLTSYASGAQVVLTATPAVGYTFSGWSGSASGTTNPLTVTMDGNKTVTASFTQNVQSATRFEQNNTLLTYSGAWSTSSSSRYSGGNLKYTNATGAKVTVAFTGTAVSYIARTTTSYGIAKVTLDGNVSYVDLYSSSSQYKKTVWSAAGLTDGPHTLVIERNYTKNLASSSYTIDLDALDIVGTLTVPAVTYTLTTNVSGSGAITRDPNLTSYEPGTQVVLTATPASGYVFTGWSGSASGTTNPLTVTMNANKTVTATFTSTSAPTYTLTTNVSGSGTILRNPDQASYASGTQVVLTATPASGYVFTGWSGSATGTTNPLTVTMDANKSVTATFVVSIPGVTRYEQDHAYLSYAGTWSAGSGASYSGLSYKYANALGAKVTAKFTGTAVTYIARAGSTYGRAKVTLDGVVTYVDLYSASTVYQKAVWSRTGLSSGTHTLTIEYSGTRNSASWAFTVNLDALIITGTLLAP